MTLAKRVKKLEENSKNTHPKIVFWNPQETVEEAIKRTGGQGEGKSPVMVVRWER